MTNKNRKKIQKIINKCESKSPLQIFNQLNPQYFNQNKYY